MKVIQCQGQIDKRTRHDSVASDGNASTNLGPDYMEIDFKHGVLDTEVGLTYAHHPAQIPSLITT